MVNTEQEKCSEQLQILPKRHIIQISGWNFMFGGIFAKDGEKDENILRCANASREAMDLSLLSLLVRHFTQLSCFF